ncbi:MAG: sulfatase [Tannerellaceae bacterium]|nr:sulfatase [Tannerellaceae bacterium]
MNRNYTTLFSACLLAIPACRQIKAENPVKKPNILFICVDDLRRELGCYGSPVITPHLDALASEGSLFFQHYVQVPTSGASRASMLTGRFPRERQDLSNEACRTRLSGLPESDYPETFFHHLRRNGYYTVGVGKVSHYVDGYLYGYTDPTGNRLELPYSWNEMLFDPGKWGNGWNAFFGYADGTNRQSENKQVLPYECGEVDDMGYPDGLTAALAVDKMKQLADKDMPFCLAVGFFKPHLPFTAPRKYWELYDPENIPPTPVPGIPEGSSLLGLHNSDEFNSYEKGSEKPSLTNQLSDEYARTLRHAYFACISYVDAQIGKLLSGLDNLGLAENTIVIVWGDHGWHLGDHRIWGKHSLFETSLSSAFIVKAPDKARGVKNHRIVSSVDIYPTLMDLCNIALPDSLDGKSFVSLLDNPLDKEWTDVSYSYYRNGFSVRVPDYRFTRYRKDTLYVNELYQYTDDRYERINIAGDHEGIVNTLLPVWEKGNILKY